MGELALADLVPQHSSYAMGTVSGTFHIFLSHVWGTGQDQMRIVKQRLLEMMPQLSIFLDIDDLDEVGKVADYVERSRHVLICCTKGYFNSKNCVHELQVLETLLPDDEVIDTWELQVTWKRKGFQRGQ